MRPTIQEILGVPVHYGVNQRHKTGLHLERIGDGGVRGDPCNCAIAQEARRVNGHPAAIFARMAYFVLTDAKGRPYIAKLQSTEATRKKIRTFDRTGMMPAGGLDFIPIAESHTTEGRRLRRQIDYKGPRKGLKQKKRKPQRTPSWLRVTPKGMIAGAVRYSD